MAVDTVNRAGCRRQSGIGGGADSGPPGAFWPRIGAWIVCLWLWAIITNLLIARGFYDIALRDFGLSLGAIALARLSSWMRTVRA